MRTPLQAAHNAWRQAEKAEDSETQQEWLYVCQSAALLAIAESLAVIAAGSPVSQYAADIIRQQTEGTA